jgi:hypothetical protein
MADGVDIVLDQYDLKEGHDKYAFMEKMVTAPSVTHILVVCDTSFEAALNMNQWNTIK